MVKSNQSMPGFTRDKMLGQPQGSARAVPCVSEWGMIEMKKMIIIGLLLLSLMTGCTKEKIESSIESSHLWDLEITTKNHEIESDGFIWLNGDLDLEIEINNPTNKNFDNLSIWYNIYDPKNSTTILTGVPLKIVNISGGGNERVDIDLPCYCTDGSNKPVIFLTNTKWVYCTDEQSIMSCTEPEDFVECNSSCVINRGEYVIEINLRDKQNREIHRAVFYVFSSNISPFDRELFTSRLDFLMETPTSELNGDLNGN